MVVARGDYLFQSLDSFPISNYPLSRNLAPQYSGSWDLVWLAIALWLASLVVDAHQDTRMVGLVCTWEADSLAASVCA